VDLKFIYSLFFFFINKNKILIKENVGKFLEKKKQKKKKKKNYFVTIIYIKGKKKK